MSSKMARLLCFAFLLVLSWEVHGFEFSDGQNAISRFFAASKSEPKEHHRYCHGSGLQPYFRTCTKYILCLNQIGYLMKCSPGLHFNWKIQKCVVPCAAFCDPDFACICHWKKCVIKPPECPKPNGNFSVPTNCSRYTECKESQSTNKDCPKGNSFDIEKKRCVPSDEAICYISEKQELDSPAFRCPEKNGNFSLPMNCSQYIECMDSKPTIRDCPKEQSFDRRKNICVPWYEAISYLSSTRDLKFPIKFICPERNGNFSVPLDCTKYFDCTNSESTPKECPSGQFFDSRKKICVRWYEALCDPSKWAGTNSKRTECSPNGDFTYILDCKKFIRCRHTYLFLLDCPEGKTFDTVKKECLPDEEVKCLRKSFLS